MNKSELATGVYKHPLIQEIIRRQIVGSSVINHLIVEEVLSELAPRTPEEILATTIKKMEGATDEQIKNYVSAAENKINVQAILKAIEDIDALTNPNTGFQESETELLKKFASAAANVEQFGFDDVISEWIKAQIAAKAAPPLEKFVARIPVGGWITAAANVFGVSLEEWAITKLLFPVDLLVDSIWEGIGAKDAEDLIGQVMGREVYEKIVQASPDKAKILEVLKTVDYKNVMAKMLLLAKDSDNAKIQEKYDQLANMKIKGYPIGQWIIKAVLGDELPDPGKEADTTTDTETTTDTDTPTDTPTDTETDGTEDEETDPTATTLKLAFSEKQNEDWLTASRDFEKNFLKVPWLRMQQDIMIKLLDAINGLNNELESLSSRRDELDEAEDSGVDKAALKKIRSDLRYIERKIKEIKSSLRGFLDKSSTTRRGESVKKELVRSINELQISIAKTYEDFGRLAPVELDEALDPEETKEQKIEKVEGVYDRVVPLIRQLNTIMNKSNDSGKFVNIESEIKRELESITKYFPSTAKFMPSATQGTKEAVIGFVKAIEMFRKDELVEIYSLTSEGQITPRLIKDAKTALQNLSDTIESLLGVDSRIPASEAVVVSDDEESFTSDSDTKDDDVERSTTYDVSHLNELTSEEQAAISEFLERLNKKIFKDAPEGARSEQEGFLQEAIEMTDFANINEKYTQALIKEIIQEMGEQGNLVMSAFGKVSNINDLFEDEFELQVEPKKTPAAASVREALEKMKDIIDDFESLGGDTAEESLNDIAEYLKIVKKEFPNTKEKYLLAKAQSSPDKNLYQVRSLEPYLGKQWHGPDTIKVTYNSKSGDKKFNYVEVKNIMDYFYVKRGPSSPQSLSEYLVTLQTGKKDLEEQLIKKLKPIIEQMLEEQ